MIRISLSLKRSLPWDVFCSSFIYWASCVIPARTRGYSTFQNALKLQVHDCDVTEEEYLKSLHFSLITTIPMDLSLDSIEARTQHTWLCVKSTPMPLQQENKNICFLSKLSGFIIFIRMCSLNENCLMLRWHLLYSVLIHDWNNGQRVPTCDRLTG